MAIRKNGQAKNGQLESKHVHVDVDVVLLRGDDFASADITLASDVSPDKLTKLMTIIASRMALSHYAY